MPDLKTFFYLSASSLYLLLNILLFLLRIYLMNSLIPTTATLNHSLDCMEQQPTSPDSLLMFKDETHTCVHAHTPTHTQIEIECALLVTDTIPGTLPS